MREGPTPRALVTGATGFVGANLVRCLADAGVDVVGLHRPGGDAWRLSTMAPRVRIETVDLLDAAAVRGAVAAARPTWIFHLAAYGAYPTQRDMSRILETNVVATATLLEAAAEHDVDAFVHAGSSSEYGFLDHPADEDESLQPNSTYGVAKAAATMLCRQFSQETGLRATTARLYSVYGPWEEPTRLVPQLLVHALEARLPALVSPDIARDFVHVDDVCSALLLLARESAPGSVYNVCTGTQTTIHELVTLAREIVGVPTPDPVWGSLEPRSWDTTTWVGNPGRLGNELGWRAGVDLAEGLRRTLEWLQTSDIAARYRRAID